MPEKYVVPQFIDNEDKILGPITVRQFLILLAEVVILFVSYKLFTTGPFVAIAFVTAVLAGTFGFAKVQGQMFHLFFLNALQSLMRPSLRVWDKELTDAQLREFMEFDKAKAIVEKTGGKERPSSSRLRDLTLIVNTGGVYKPDEDPTF